MVESEVNESSVLYVDVENLQSHAQELLVLLLENWPPKIPRPTKVVLYVRADMVELWRTWALANISEQMVEVNGVQHFAASQSRNSADIAIAVEAVSDLLKGLAHHVAVFSDDSDFISLFAKIRAETKDIQARMGRIPFLWILTDRASTKTPNIHQFFPPEYLHVVRAAPEEPAPMAGPLSINAKTESMEESIALAIIRELPIGTFKSPDVQTVIKRDFHEHPMASLDSMKFGTEFLNTIWPHLQRRGVKSPAQKPRRYEMTQAAKDSITR